MMPQARHRNSEKSLKIPYREAEVFAARTPPLTPPSRGGEVVHDCSIDVPYGAIYGFLGPNGTGKTTTIRMLCGLLTVDSGEGVCLGYNIRTQSALIKRQTG